MFCYLNEFHSKNSFPLFCIVKYKNKLMNAKETLSSGKKRRTFNFTFIIKVKLYFIISVLLINILKKRSEIESVLVRRFKDGLFMRHNYLGQYLI